MKNLFAAAFVGTFILAACSQKETNVESNTMLEEPEVTVQDSPTQAYGDGSPVAPDSVSIDPQTPAAQ